MNSHRYTVTVALIVALGGFLFGFDASVISGVVGFIEKEFELSALEIGWAVSSLTLTSTIAMMIAGPLSDRLGRRPVLKITALLFAVSAVASALAPNYAALVAARMLGGLGVGAALIVAPMYIAEIAPARVRGRMVSFNQLNIVVGISAAFFSNYVILTLGDSGLPWLQNLHLDDWSWRWMLGIEAVPAVIYYFALLAVPESPRWLVMHDREDDAHQVLEKANGPQAAAAALADIREAVQAARISTRVPVARLFAPAMRTVLTIGICVAILQQITGINAVFFYAPMIFEQSGVGTDASFMQAVLVGIVNLLFTVVAILLIDRLGRRPLLLTGLAGIAVCMFTLSWGFGSAEYTLASDDIAALESDTHQAALAPLAGRTFDSDVAFREAVTMAAGADTYTELKSQLVPAAIDVNATLILFAILGFVASFAMSLGPVMWVLFSELFPNALRGLAISFVGLINSAVSFGVQLVFPWELQVFGNAVAFALFGAFALAGLLVIARIMPETKGRSLEELERILVTSKA